MERLPNSIVVLLFTVLICVLFTANCHVLDSPLVVSSLSSEHYSRGPFGLLNPVDSMVSEYMVASMHYDDNNTAKFYARTFYI